MKAPKTTKLTPLARLTREVAELKLLVSNLQAEFARVRGQTGMEQQEILDSAFSPASLVIDSTSETEAEEELDRMAATKERATKRAAKKPSRA